MNFVGKHAHPRTLLFSALLILPAVVLGVLAMILGGVSPALWGQQLAAWGLFALLAWPLRRAASKLSPTLWTVLFLILLAATLLRKDVGGVRRWLDLGIVNVNAAMLVLPAFLAALHRTKFPFPALLAAAAVLCFQPDLSQLAAFSAAALPILWNRRNERFFASASALALVALVIRCLLAPMAVEPVEYCEGILTMLGNLSPLLIAAGVAALAVIPMCFGYQYLRLQQPQLLSFAVYYAVSMLFVLSGDYPVPFMGFGLSPIAGYWLAYICTVASAPAGQRPCQAARPS